MVGSVIQTSFGAGEFSPSLAARVDLEKYRSAAALLRNFWVDYKGGALSRPGTLYVGTCLHQDVQPILIPFIVSTSAAYIIEAGNLYFRFIANGAYVIDGGTGLPLVVTTPYAIADLPLLKWGQSVNVLTLTHPSYPVYNLTRTSPTSFSLVAETFGPTIQPPTGLVGNPAGSTAAKANLYGYVVTAVDENGQESIACQPVYVPSDALNPTAATPILIDLGWAASAGAVSYNIYKGGPTGSGVPASSNATSPPTVFGYIGSSQAFAFTDNNIGPDFSHTPPTYTDPFSPGQVAQVGVSAQGSTYTGYSVPLTFTGGGGSGAAGYAVVNKTAGTVIGVVLTNPGKGYTSAPTVHDTGPNLATYTCSIGPTTGTYPSTITYHQQRRVFGGTTNFPESLVMSQPGAFDNFDTRLIAESDDAITVNLASTQANVIESLISMNTGLIALTSGGGFLIQGGSASGSLTPADIGAFPQASSGANNLPPLRINYDVLYGQARGFVVRDFAFNFYVQSYTGTDRSVLASHLFTGFSAVSWAYAEEPFRQIHVVRNDGVLLNFTYVPEQEIFAWTRTDTYGQFISVASIPEGTVNAVYVIVRRPLNGIWTYMVERFQPRTFFGVENAWCLDCALQLAETSPNATITLQGISADQRATPLIVTSDTAIFAPGDVGKGLWAQWGGVQGYGIVTAYVSSTEINIQVYQDFAVVPDDISGLNLSMPFPPGSWTYDAPVTAISGLTQLSNMLVMALADGQVVGPLRVDPSGHLTLPHAATKVVVGLPYTCQLQTLRLDTGQPTTQGKRKNIVAVTTFFSQSAVPGLEVGPDFDNLRPFSIDNQVPFYPPTQLFDGLQREVIPSTWTVDGQVCYQQTNPLPVTILGIVPEFMMGDDAR